MGSSTPAICFFFASGGLGSYVSPVAPCTNTHSLCRDRNPNSWRKTGCIRDALSLGQRKPYLLCPAATSVELWSPHSLPSCCSWTLVTVLFPYKRGNLGKKNTNVKVLWSPSAFNWTKVSVLWHFNILLSSPSAVCYISLALIPPKCSTVKNSSKCKIPEQTRWGFHTGRVLCDCLLFELGSWAPLVLLMLVGTGGEWVLESAFSSPIDLHGGYFPNDIYFWVSVLSAEWPVGVLRIWGYCSSSPGISSSGVYCMFNNGH